MRASGRLLAAGAALTSVMSATASAQSPSASATYAIKALRWEEDYSVLPVDAPGFKRIGLGERAFVSLGGEVRWRAEAYDQPLFGRLGAEDFSSLNTRLLVHGDLHLAPRARVFLEFGAGDEWGREPGERPFDESALDLAQGFIDLGRQSSFRARIGRQELPFGRFISLRDSTNLRRTFDGARADGAIGDYRWTGFAAAPTRNRPGAFDDDADPEDFAAGLAITRNGWTATYFQRRDNRARYAAGAGEEVRHSVALRYSGERGPWRWDTQGAAQFGTLERSDRRLDIRAYGLASEVSRGLDGPWRPRLALRIDAAGGDERPDDGTLGTFDLGFPNLGYLSDAAAIAPRNVFDIHPFVTATPGRQVSLTGGVELLWRLQRGDAVYAPPFLLISPPNTAGGAFVGAQWYARAVWRPGRHAEVLASLVRVEPGPAITRAGGEAQTFAAVQTSLRY